MGRQEPPPRLAAEVLAANNHTCCICRVQRKHVQLHHIDGNSSNSVPSNLAVVCLDDHSRVTGDEGLGRRFSPQEVTLFKVRWEAICAQADMDEDDDEDDEPEEPLESVFQTRLIRANEEYAFTFQMEEGQELICSLSADDYIDISICTARDYQRWLDGEDLMEYIGEEDVLHCDLPPFVAPRNGKFVVAIMNNSDEDVDVTVDIAIWAGGDEDEDDGR